MNGQIGTPPLPPSFLLTYQRVPVQRMILSGSERLVSYDLTTAKTDFPEIFGPGRGKK